MNNMFWAFMCVSMFAYPMQKLEKPSSNERKLYRRPISLSEKSVVKGALYTTKKQEDFNPCDFDPRAKVKEPETIETRVERFQAMLDKKNHLAGCYCSDCLEQSEKALNLLEKQLDGIKRQPSVNVARIAAISEKVGSLDKKLKNFSLFPKIEKEKKSKKEKKKNEKEPEFKDPLPEVRQEPYAGTVNEDLVVFLYNKDGLLSPRILYAPGYDALGHLRPNSGE